MEIDDTTRASIQQQFAALDAARKALDVAMKPFRDADSAILEARELLLEHYEIEIAGKCESCSKVLFVGEQGHSSEDGPMFCAEDSPSWGDCEDQWKEIAGGEDDDPERREAFERSIAAHLAAGGRRDDHLTHAL